ncbi:MAG: hypothetical protein ACFFG0_00070 [Candidatus Thorarchaeota archaeon]
MLKTHVAFCLDESGSIRARGLTKPLVDSYNKNVKSIRESVLDQGQEASMTALAFGHRTLKHRILYVGQQVQTVVPLNESDLSPTGMTPLFDSLYRAIQKLSELDDGDENTTFLINVITDGEENQSHNPGVAATIKLMDEKMATDRWTFTFLIPQQYIKTFLRDFKVSEGNVQEWETTVEGMETATVTNVAAFNNYFANRSRGVRSTKSFYSDLSNVTVRSARSDLSEITKQVTIIQPKKECRIKECIEEAGHQYIKGAAFYQLVKTEKKVQPYKMVAIRVKRSGKIYCGQDAREMLGLSTDKTVRLVPGDHGKFDVFIQSTSYTRKIPANTMVLYWPKVGTQKK